MFNVFRSKKKKKIQFLEKKVNDLETALSKQSLIDNDTDIPDDSSLKSFCCSICLCTGNIPQLNTSCGHTYCNKCWEQISNRKCPFCRTTIEKLITNYIILGETPNSPTNVSTNN